MVKSFAKAVLREMALDLGNTPDWIDPEKKRKIQRRQDPFSQNPAWPQQKPARRPGAPYKAEEPPERPDPTEHYGEVVASHVYPAIVDKVRQYTGRDPRRTNPRELIGDMMQALARASQLERPHRQQLEQAAVRVVLGLPEFRDAAQAVQDGDLRIDARLVEPQDMDEVGARRGAEPDEAEPDEQEERPEREGGAYDKMRVEPEEPDEEQAREMGLGVPEIRQEYDTEAGKRRFVNALIQGAAINKNYAFHEIADELRAINPQILNLYGRAMSIAELVYWNMPEQSLNQMMGMGGAGGMEEITQEPREQAPEQDEPPDFEQHPDLPQEPQAEAPQEKVWVVHAYGIVFPVLVQEIVKGLYEFLAHNEEEPNEIRDYSYRKSDTLGNEQWDIMQGPGIWRHLNHLVNQANGSEYMGRVFRHLVTLPTGEFNELMREILGETPRGRNYIRDTVNEIRQEDQGRREESQARRIIRGLR
jgi:hypothetical protein